MQTSFDITRTSRIALLKFIDSHTPEQLNKIPAGYNNNIIWNIAHIVVVQQMLVYKLSGLPMMVPDEMVAKYMRGTKPEGNVSQEEIDQIRGFLFATIDKTEADYAAGLFKEYQPFTTMSGFTVNSAADAIAFNYYHEAVHTGMLMSVRKFV